MLQSLKFHAEVIRSVLAGPRRRFPSVVMSPWLVFRFRSHAAAVASYGSGSLDSHQFEGHIWCGLLLDRLVEQERFAYVLYFGNRAAQVEGF